MAKDVLKKVPVREQDPKVRAANFEEVCLGYNQEEAMEEAARCIKCKKNAQCMTGCPVSINIPAFIGEVEKGNFKEASDADKFDFFDRVEEVKKIRTKEEKVVAIKKIVDYSLTKEDSAHYYYTREKYPHYFVAEDEFKNSKKEVRINLDVPETLYVVSELPKIFLDKEVVITFSLSL